jgi:glycosyltransferase involved in cell wall biosynthesis
MILSVIMPVYNEIGHIERCLDSLLGGQWDFSKSEIIVLDGMSDDGTRDILRRYAESYSFIKVLDNPNRYQVSGLNIAIGASLGDYIVRCDAHSVYPNSYLVDLVDLLSKHQGIDNVGLPFVTVSEGNTSFSAVIENVMSSPVGVGYSHRSMKVTKPENVDTLLFGAWHREIFESIGEFDENFIRGQDYEHNFRIRKRGGRVVLCPGVPFQYYTRNSLIKVCKKIFQYASVKAQVIKKHRVIPNVRTFLPLLFFVSVIGLFFAVPMYALYVISLYLTILITVGCFSERSFVKGVFFAVVSFSLHISHAVGLFHGLVNYFVFGRHTYEFRNTR